MKKSEIETLTLPDGSRITGYKNECVFEDIRRHNTYFEKDMLDKWFLPRADEIACVYDIGANLGNHTVYFAAYAKNAKIFSFEPMPVNFELLKTNVEQNGLSDRVKLFQCALGSQAGNAKMQIYGRNMGACKICDQGTQEVPLKRLDDLKLPPPDFVKMDVEEYELQVLKGMERTLRESSSTLWIEIHSGSPNNQEKYEFLSSLGYFPIDYCPPFNFIFAKKTVELDEKASPFCAFIPILQQAERDARSSCAKAYENSTSWKITAPLRAIRRIFRRH